VREKEVYKETIGRQNQFFFVRLIVDSFSGGSQEIDVDQHECESVIQSRYIQVKKHHETQFSHTSIFQHDVARARILYDAPVMDDGFHQY